MDHRHLVPNARICRRQGDPSKPDAVGLLGLVRLRRGSFSLPMPSRRISLVRQGCYRASPTGWTVARTLPPIWAPIWAPAWPPVLRPSGEICAAARMAGTADRRPTLLVMEVIVRRQDLAELLAERGVGRLVVTGAQTEECIRSTLHGALVRATARRSSPTRAHHRGHSWVGLPGHPRAVGRVPARTGAGGGARPQGQRGTHRGG